MKTLSEEIRKKLHQGEVVFTFLKSDGTIREARGTLQESFLKDKLGNVYSKKTSSPKVQVFWDLDKNAWRSFTIGTEIKILKENIL